MRIHDLNPDAERLPEFVAKRVVEYGEKRLLKYGVQEYIGNKAYPASTVDISDLEVDRILGKGSFSVAYSIDDNLAIKVLQPKLLEKPHIFAACAADLVREGMLLRMLQHPNVVKCHAMGELSAFVNGRHDACFLVLDRLSCTLHSQLNEWREYAAKMYPKEDRKTSGLVNVLFRLGGGAHRRRQHTLVQRTSILCQLADAIQYLHSNRILHRDLKPDNLGLVEGGILKVFDLDVCRILPPEALQHPNKTYKFTRHVGSPRYMAPEVARGEEYNAKADVYAFGLICYEVLSLKKAYGDIPCSVLEHRVFIEGARPSMPQSWPGPVANLVHRCWLNSLEKRPTMNQVHGQLRSTLDLMTGPSDAKDRSAPHLHLEESGRTLLIESDSENLSGLFNENDFCATRNC